MLLSSLVYQGIYRGFVKLSVDFTTFWPGAWIPKYCISLCWCVWWKFRGGPTKIFYVVCLQREPFISLHLLSHRVTFGGGQPSPIWSGFTLVPISKRNGSDFALVRPTPLQWLPWALKLQCWLLMYLIFCLSPHGWNMSEEQQHNLLAVYNFLKVPVL